MLYPYSEQICAELSVRLFPSPEDTKINKVRLIKMPWGIAESVDFQT